MTMKQIFIFLIMIAAVFSVTTSTIVSPLNQSTQRSDNLTLNYMCSDGTAPYNVNLYVNQTLADTAIVAEADQTEVTFNVPSAVYNLTVECDDGTADNDSVQVGYYETKTFSVNSSVDQFTYDSFLLYTQSYMLDYMGYAASIFCFGVSFLVTKNMQQTMFAGAMGMLAIFFITGTGIFFIGSVFALAVGFVLKYTGG